MRKSFSELNSDELSMLLTEYQRNKVITDYGWKVDFSTKWFYENKHKGFKK